MIKIKSFKMKITMIQILMIKILRKI